MLLFNLLKAFDYIDNRIDCNHHNGILMHMVSYHQSRNGNTLYFIYFGALDNWIFYTREQSRREREREREGGKGGERERRRESRNGGE